MEVFFWVLCSVTFVVLILPPALLWCMDLAADMIECIPGFIKSVVDNWRELIKRIFSRE